MMPGQARVVQQSTPTGELASSPHNARPNLIKNVFDLDDKIKDDISRAIKDSNSPFVTTPPARCRPVKRVPEEADGTFETSPFHLSAAKRRRLFGQDDLKKDNLRSDLRNTDEVDVYQKQQVPVVPAAVKSILDYAQQSGFPAQEVWEESRNFLFSYALERIEKEINLVDEEPGFNYRENSVGLSYVLPTESRQQDCLDYSPLPPITIRPKLKEIQSHHKDNLLEESISSLLQGETTLSVIPSCEDSLMKTYLLYPEKRLQIVDNCNGTVKWSVSIPQFLSCTSEKAFLCLHYTAERNGEDSFVIKCTEPNPAGILKSNVQITLTMKKGVAGTAGMKAEARSFSEKGILDILSTDDLEVVLDRYREGRSRQLDCDKESPFDEDFPEKLLSAEKRLPLSTHSCRIEMFVDRNLWKEMNWKNISVLSKSLQKLGQHISNIFRSQNWENLTSYADNFKLESGRQQSLLSEDLKLSLQRYLDDTMDHQFFHSKACDQSLDEKDSEHRFLKLHVLMLTMGECFAKQVTPPLYLVSTRECFTYDIIPETTHHRSKDGALYQKQVWYIRSEEASIAFDATLTSSKEQCCNNSIESSMLDGMVSTIVHKENLNSHDIESYLLPLGIVTYNNVFSADELLKIESKCDELHDRSMNGYIPQECYQSSVSRKGSLKRTKYFFGSRYLWSKDQMAWPDAKIARGIRTDVPKIPVWIKEQVETPMLNSSIIPRDFINAVALNIYHDGSEGIQNHYDDSKRFAQPIISLRLFSDSRLSFGTQLYGYTNGLFFVPMPRGCITVMESGGFAANGVKHCVRPMDMTGKSAGMILRKINEKALRQAKQFYWDESLELFQRFSLATASIDNLVRNPLFHDDSNSKYAQSICKQKSTRQREKKEVYQIMQYLLRSIQVQHRKDRNMDLEIFSIVSGITRRVCSAQTVEWTLSDGDSSEVFRLVDDMVSFCEYPRLTLKCRTSRAMKKSSFKQKADIIAADVTDIMSAMIQDIVNSLTTAKFGHPSGTI